MIPERKKIALIIFHIITLLLLFVSTSLILDQILTHSEALNIIIITTLISIVLASISWLIIITNWIRNSTLEFYLKSILITKSILILGLILLMIFIYSST